MFEIFGVRVWWFGGEGLVVVVEEVGWRMRRVENGRMGGWEDGKMKD